MDVKQFKNLKDELNQKLYTMFRDIIQGGTISTSIKDDMEYLELVIIQEKRNSEFNTAITETVFSFNVNNAGNLNSKSNNRSILHNDQSAIIGILSDYTQMDLETLALLHNKFYEFALEHELMGDITGGVGPNTENDTTP